MTKYKLRASYTVLSMWEKGRWEEAIESYFKMSSYTSRAMGEGKDYHEEWCNFITQNKKLPELFGGKLLVNPVCERKLIVNVEDWLDLSLIIDCYDEPILYEWKTGISSSQDYSRTMQMPVYALGATLAGFKAKKGEIYHFNQHDNKVDMSIIWVTDQTIKDGLEYVETYGSEMYNYFVENDLFAKLGKGIDGKGDK